MHPVISKFIVACLFVFGNGAFAYENSVYSDGRSAPDSYSVELSKSEISENQDTQPQPSSAILSQITAEASDTPVAIVLATSIFSSELQSYRSFHPRAPPTPAT